MSAVRLFGDAETAAPRTASAKQVRYALSALGFRQAFEDAAAKGTQAMQDWWNWCDPIPENAPKLARLCAAAGTTPGAVMDAAVTA